MKAFMAGHEPWQRLLELAGQDAAVEPGVDWLREARSLVEALGLECFCQRARTRLTGWQSEERNRLKSLLWASSVVRDAGLEQTVVSLLGAPLEPELHAVVVWAVAQMSPETASPNLVGLRQELGVAHPEARPAAVELDAAMQTDSLSGFVQ